MIDLSSESLIKLSDVPMFCHEILGNRVHRSTVHRRRLRGVRGVKLETVLAGGTRYTSLEKIERFFAATTAAADGHAFDSGLTNVKAFANAESFLEAEGI